MSALSHELENAARRSSPRPHRAHAAGARSPLPSRRALRAHPRGREGAAPKHPPEVDELLARARQRRAAARAEPAAASARSTSSIPGLLGVLTEYEEHRLRTNIEQGLALYRLRVQFQLATIDQALDDLKATAKPHGEIITFLPTGEGARRRLVELDILWPRSATLDVLAARCSATSGTEHRRDPAARRGRRPAVPSLGAGGPTRIPTVAHARGGRAAPE